MIPLLRPAADWELSNIVTDAAARRLPLEIYGSGTKREMGRPIAAAAHVSLKGMLGTPAV